MASHHPTEPDSARATTDSVTSSPNSHAEHHHPFHDNAQLHQSPRVRFMCSFGGKILPRPHDNLLRYVGGDTRIVAVQRHTTFSSLLNKLCKLSGAANNNVTVKYQLPNEDLDALITVTSDEDVENMMDEYERLALNHTPANSKMARLRLFLFPVDGPSSRASSISSLLDGSTKREHWFLDALNGGSGLERGRSEVSSIVSEVPDYLFGLDNSDDLLPIPSRDTKHKTRPFSHETGSDPGSPVPVAPSPFCSTSSSLAGPTSVPPLPDLRPVKTKRDNRIPVVEKKEAPVEAVAETAGPAVMQQTGYSGNPMWHYVQGSPYPRAPVQNVPVYYVQGSVPTDNVPHQPVPVGFQQHTAHPGQMQYGIHQPVQGMGQVYGRQVPLMDPYDMSGRVTPDQSVYYEVRNGAGISPYPGMVVPGGEEFQGSGGTESKAGRLPTSSGEK